MIADHAQRDNVAGDGSLQVLRSSLGDDLSVIDDRDPVAQRVRLVKVVRRQKDRRASVVHPPHLIPHAGTALRVEAGGRLVEEKQLRVVDKSQPDVEAALLAACICADLEVGGALELEHLDQLRGSFLGGRDRQPVEAALKDELGASDDLAVGPPGLAHVPDPFSDLVRLGGEIAGGDSRRAAAWRQEGGQHAQRGRLACAVRSEEAEDLAPAHAEVDTDHGFDQTLPGLKNAPQTVRLDYRFRILGVHPPRFSPMPQPRCR